MTAMTLRLIPAAALLGLLALAQAPAAGADPGPPANPWEPGFLGTQPGGYGYLYSIYVVPPPPTVDARGVKVTAGTTVDPTMQAYGMPGSQLGNTPPIVGFFTGASMQRYAEAGQTAHTPPALGVNAVALSPAVPPEDPSGIPPKTPPEIESTQPGPESVIVPPILETPGGRPLGVPGGGAG